MQQCICLCYTSQKAQHFDLCSCCSNYCRRSDGSNAFLVLDLPDDCLLAVLRCFGGDPRSLFSAARAHSRLHQAAVLAASSIKAALQQQHVSSILQYLTSYGQHIDSIDLKAYQPACNLMHQVITLHELPHNQLQGLSSLRLNRVLLQLQPGGGYPGVVGAAAPITNLQLERCVLLDGEEGLAAALPLLPKLQHLSLIGIVTRSGSPISFPSSALQSLQQLTYLETTGPWLPEPVGVGHLQGLTCLQDLRLHGLHKQSIHATVMAGLQQLTYLKVEGYENSCVFEPGVLEGKCLLQHLAVVDCSIAGGSAGVSELLWHLQQLQHLTYINFRSSLRIDGLTLLQRPPQPSQPAASCSTSTSASAPCQKMPSWQHLFPADRLALLPHLRELHIGGIRNHAGPAAAPDVSRLVSCCPGLQVLTMPHLQYSGELLAPLTGLASLQRLDLSPVAGSTEGLEVVCQLTGLRQLHLKDPRGGEGLLFQLTQLKQLTKLQYCWDTFVQVSAQVALASCSSQYLTSIQYPKSAGAVSKRLHHVHLVTSRYRSLSSLLKSQTSRVLLCSL